MNTDANPGGPVSPALCSKPQDKALQLKYTSVSFIYSDISLCQKELRGDYINMIEQGRNNNYLRPNTTMANFSGVGLF